ncbi:unnamed protein product [Darwinula stevensoni]|uniref:Ionotropic glutamate receptor C-terminal domain-containing protein n=1 Tax=Darwinula stevensoni TaxID=69355 RepID=A0A7R9FPV0_9CRUS|nr:unnamed protein product [Darwinula stevensoni]CAG0898193.1 unnamed protein product [Darwinula stevensoni]
MVILASFVIPECDRIARALRGVQVPKEITKFQRLLFFMHSLTQMTDRRRPKSHSSKVFYAVWLLFAVVFGAIYSSTLVSHLSVRQYSKPIDSLEDLLQAVEFQGYSWGTVEGSVLLDLFQTSESGIYKSLWEEGNKRGKTVFLADSIEQGIVKVDNGTFAFGFSETACRYWTSMRGKYRFHLAKKTFFPHSSGMAVNKGAPYHARLNSEVRRFVEAGFIGHWMQQVFDSASMQSYQKGKEDEGEDKPLNLKDLQSAFYLLFIGHGISLLLLVAENFGRCIVESCNDARMAALKSAQAFFFLAFVSEFLLGSTSFMGSFSLRMLEIRREEQEFYGEVIQLLQPDIIIFTNGTVFHIFKFLEYQVGSVFRFTGSNADNKFHLHTNIPDVSTDGSHMKHLLSFGDESFPHCPGENPWDCLFPDLEAIFRDFRGRTLVVAGAKEGMPFFSFHDFHDRVVPDGGIELSLVDCLARTLNFTYEILDDYEATSQKDEDGDWGVSTGNGTFTGLIGLVQTGRAHLAISELTITQDRTRIVDFTYPHAMDEATIVSPKSSEITSPFMIVQPFSVWVWILTVLVVILSSFVIAESDRIVQALRGAQLPTERTYFHRLLLFLQSPIQQTVRRRPKSYSSRVSFAVWLLFALIFGAIYCGTLISHLSARRYRNPINSLNDLLNAVEFEDYSWGTVDGTALLQLFQTSESGLYKSLWENGNARGKAVVLTESIDEGISKIEQGNFAFLSGKTASRYWTSMLGEERFQVARETFFSHSHGIAVSKGAPYHASLDSKVMRVVQSGLMDHWMQEVFNAARLHSHRWDGEGDGDDKPIKLEELQGAFYILLIGHGAALLVLAAERSGRRDGAAGSPRCSAGRRIVIVKDRRRGPKLTLSEILGIHSEKSPKSPRRRRHARRVTTNAVTNTSMTARECHEMEKPPPFDRRNLTRLVGE